mmetsp:Transcript_67174/g.185706  ORF Transcript_67174/g.185706 Transcript_67174/m.185706 type:complete len:251 (+) Transcript_67174:270-1022(+)
MGDSLQSRVRRRPCPHDFDIVARRCKRASDVPGVCYLDRLVDGVNFSQGCDISSSRGSGDGGSAQRELGLVALVGPRVRRGSAIGRPAPDHRQVCSLLRHGDAAGKERRGPAVARLRTRSRRPGDPRPLRLGARRGADLARLACQVAGQLGEPDPRGTLLRPDADALQEDALRRHPRVQRFRRRRARVQALRAPRAATPPPPPSARRTAGRRGRQRQRQRQQWQQRHRGHGSVYGEHSGHTGDGGGLGRR